MILLFKPQFIHPIFTGHKKHTIRRDESNQWHAGMVAHLVIEPVPGDYKEFDQRMVSGIQNIYMSYFMDILEVVVDEHYLNEEEKTQLAINDGFKDWEAFTEWFIPVCEQNEYGTYYGKIIHFTPFRYQ